VFLCKTDAPRVLPAERLLAYGRFNHEAACVHPRSLTAYLTEDRSDGCLYRYRPENPAQPFTSGRLQALRVSGIKNLDTTKDLDHGTPLEVDWVDIPNPNPRDDTVRQQAAAAGAARFCRGEGMVLSGDTVYFSCTSGGRQGTGQIFKLSIGTGRDGNRDKVELFAESPGPSVLDMPDSLCLTPWGDLLVAEDGPGEQFLRGITPEGRVYDIARNARSSGEFAGICLSPRADALFVNLQMDGLTVAIMGPLTELSRRAKHLARRPA